MNCSIRRLTVQDTDRVLAMMRTFYASDAVASNGSEEIFRADITTCLSDSPYLEGYVFDNGTDLQGYAMVAKSFSTEFGKPCLWIEDLYVQPTCRGSGLGGAFLSFLREQYPAALFRLEVEAENTRAVKLYEKHGFSFLPYQEMKR